MRALQTRGLVAAAAGLHRRRPALPGRLPRACNCCWTPPTRATPTAWALRPAASAACPTASRCPTWAGTPCGSSVSIPCGTASPRTATSTSCTATTPTRTERARSWPASPTYGVPSSAASTRGTTWWRPVPPGEERGDGSAHLRQLRAAGCRGSLMGPRRIQYVEPDHGRRSQEELRQG